VRGLFRDCVPGPFLACVLPYTSVRDVVFTLIVFTFCLFAFHDLSRMSGDSASTSVGVLQFIRPKGILICNEMCMCLIVVPCIKCVPAKVVKYRAWEGSEISGR
jgi:hypothetical protein